MGNNMYDLKDYPALNRLAHNLHQQETWFRAAEFYKRRVKSQNRKERIYNKRKEKCLCMEDTYDSLILKHLEELADHIREGILDVGPIPKTAHGEHGGELPPEIRNERTWEAWKVFTYGNVTTNRYQIVLNEDREKKIARYVGNYINCKLNF